MDIGKRIRLLRERLDMTQVELANKIHSTKQTIYKYENGVITNIPSDKIELLAEALDTTPVHLMGWDEAKLIQAEEEVEKEALACQAEILFGNGICDMLLKYDSMNEIGQKKVRDNIDDLSKIYSKDHLEPQAAHERTDIEVTDDMRKHDNDIMDDDAFWNK